MASKATVRVHPDVRLHTVNANLYGHFAEHLGRCIYEGVWVGDHPKIAADDGIRRDTVEALRAVALPVLRWPGGCFADNYHWRDGIGPRAQRPRRHNLWWNQPETNQFGTDEFMRFCALIGTEPYLCTNVGSGTVQEASDWVEYCNSTQNTTLARLRAENGHAAPYNVRYWGIGNENWGCGGNMRPEYYADLYAQFATYLRGRGGDMKLIACGSHPGIPQWDERFLETLKGRLGLVDYVAIHIYSGHGSSDTDFTDDEYYRLVIDAVDGMDRHIRRVSGLTQTASGYGHEIGVILDEWGTWFREATTPTGLYQQNTMRDALWTAASFHCFHRHERLFMTNMAQTINVLQALVLTRGPELIVTPTFHVYEMFKPHRGGRLVASSVTSPSISTAEGRSTDAVSVSATVSEDGARLFASLVNLDLSAACEVALDAGADWRLRQARRLGCADVRDHNTFEAPKAVQPEALPADALRPDGTLSLPARSITTLEFEPVD